MATSGTCREEGKITTDEVQDAKTKIDKTVAHVMEKGDKKPISEFTRDWA